MKFIEKSFVGSNLRRHITYTDMSKYTELNSEDGRVSIVQSALKQIDSNKIFENFFKTDTFNQKEGYIVTKVETLVVLRLLERNLRTAYKIKPKGREEIISVLISFLKECSPYSIFRADIKSFYETTNTRELFNKLKNDKKLSKVTLNHLNNFFESTKKLNVQGLPRGMGISAVLSEIALSKLDKAISDRDDVFYYARFVDDIIIIFEKDVQASTIKEAVKNNLLLGLVIHERGDKSHTAKANRAIKQKINNNNNKISKEKVFSDFSYLGYRFKIVNISDNKSLFLNVERRKVIIDISSDKVKRIKKRLQRAFSNYLSGKPPTGDDYNLLINRLKFLTGNYEIFDPNSKVKVKSGIYYNYKYTNCQTGLANIDNYMRSLLFKSGYRLNNRIISSLPLDIRRSLAGFSFKNGFNNIKFYRFEKDNLISIKKVWQ
jgi:hypothetical protein